MTYKTLKLSSMLLASCLALQSSPFAGELDIEILKTTSFEDLKQSTKDLSIEPLDFSGITMLNDDAEITDDFTSADEYRGESFKQGDFIMLCFRPPVSLYVRIVDTAPNGKETVLFPSDGDIAKQVKGGKRYCVGDENSDTMLMMDEASGIGKGRVWIIGTSNEAKAEQMSLQQFSLPQVGNEHKKAAGSVTSKIGIVSKFEGWVTYEVQ